MYYYQDKGTRKLANDSVGAIYTLTAGPGGYKVYLWAKREGANIRIYTNEPLPNQDQQW
jgi:hypothetical protein